jgi:hypothetical protein
MTEAVVQLQNDVIPTKDTKLVLAGVVRVPPIGNKCFDANNEIDIMLLKCIYLAIGAWQWGDKSGMRACARFLIVIAM